jgi:hypothetical protein
MQARLDRTEALVFTLFGLSARSIFQTAACNATHTIVQRIATWLLAGLARTGSPEFEMTQDQLAQMLGVGRTYVPAAVSSSSKTRRLCARDHVAALPQSKIIVTRFYMEFIRSCDAGASLRRAMAVAADLEKECRTEKAPAASRGFVRCRLRDLLSGWSRVVVGPKTPLR